MCAASLGHRSAQPYLLLLRVAVEASVVRPPDRRRFARGGSLRASRAWPPAWPLPSGQLGAAEAPALIVTTTCLLRSARLWRGCGELHFRLPRCAMTKRCAGSWTCWPPNLTGRLHHPTTSAADAVCCTTPSATPYGRSGCQRTLLTAPPGKHPTPPSRRSTPALSPHLSRSANCSPRSATSARAAVDVSWPSSRACTSPCSGHRRRQRCAPTTARFPQPAGGAWSLARPRQRPADSGPTQAT